MKAIITAVLLTTAGTTQASSCWKRFVAIQKEVGKKPINYKLAKHMCVYFKDQAMLERAISISYLESTWRNVVSQYGEDYGVFQFSEDTIADLGLDKNYLMLSLFYQFHTFNRFMERKLHYCYKRKVPEACWHSVTPKFHKPYARKYKAIHTIVTKHMKGIK